MPESNQKDVCQLKRHEETFPSAVRIVWKETPVFLISDVWVFERTFKRMYLHIILVQG